MTILIISVPFLIEVVYEIPEYCVCLDTLDPKAIAVPSVK
jgi:hypothetical protein